MEGHYCCAGFLHAVRKTTALASADCEAFATMVGRWFLVRAGSPGWHVPGKIAFFGSLPGE